MDEESGLAMVEIMTETGGNMIGHAPGRSHLGFQRDWNWRGWRVRYTFLRPAQGLEAGSYPVLFLHGFGASLSQWQANLKPLSQHHTVYAMDLLGFGASEKAPAAYETNLWVEQVYEFWRSLIRTPMIVVGHSLGAVVALAAAAKYPDMVQGLTLLTLPPARQEMLSGRMMKLALGVEGLFATPLILGPVFALFRSPKLIGSVLRSAAYHDRSFVTDELVDSFIAPILDKGSSRVFYRLAKARTSTTYTPAVRSLLPQIQCSILLLWGEQDKIVPLAQGKDFPRLNPKVTLVTLPNAGHCLYDECADRVNQKVLSWIATLDFNTEI
ncbi:alpha/beta fold hydrolase [Leptolyngbya sp. AN02str]|uniref:alpha/beta fold hydrolase n=1 Tax=Leptolyngbya sp. AN02str TaxID=3423363 RepID=UPI003D31A6C3